MSVCGFVHVACDGDALLGTGCRAEVGHTEIARERSTLATFDATDNARAAGWRTYVVWPPPRLSIMGHERVHLCMECAGKVPRRMYAPYSKGCTPRLRREAVEEARRR